MPLSSLTARLQGAGASLPRPRVSWRSRRAGGPASPPRSNAGAARSSGGRRRLTVLVGLVLLALLVVVYFGVRMSGLSTVQDVTVVGVRGPEATKIRAAIERAAQGQSTLGFDDDAIRKAVARNQSITGVDVHTRFPHGVQIEVQQRLAVGAIESGGRRVAVAADGTLLADWPAGTLPVIRNGRASDGRLVRAQHAAVEILGAAPAAILAKVARIDQTTIVRLADGPALLFRDTHRVNAKWAAAIAVLSDPKTKGATWIDLRIPEQPVAGSGAPPTLPKRDAAIATPRTATGTGATSGAAAGAGGTAVAGAASTPGATPDSATGTTQTGTVAPADGAAVEPGTDAAAQAADAEGGTVSPAPNAAATEGTATSGGADTSSTARSGVGNSTDSGAVGGSTGTGGPPATNASGTTAEAQNQP